MSLTTMKKRSGWPACGGLLLGLLLIALPLAAGDFAVYVSAKQPNTIYVIDPANNKVVQQIKGLGEPHGVNFSPDGKRIYVSGMFDKVLEVVDRGTGKIIKKIPLSGEPNTIAVTKDGARIFVAIWDRTPGNDAPGALDVIDATSLEKVKSLPMKAGLHDITLTPDGKYVVCGSNEIGPNGKFLVVVSVQTEEPVWSIKFDTGVLVQAFDVNPDGSTHRIFLGRHFLHAFDVVDFAERKVVVEIKLPEVDEARIQGYPYDPSHGMAVSPDDKVLWVDSSRGATVFAYSLPDLKLLSSIPISGHPHWLAVSPDSKEVYAASPTGNLVSVIDAKTLKEVAVIPNVYDGERIYTAARP
jgi:YVTN family beta-propeller protein